jgi:drug/metabolite transporter (DMT)-like permease
MVVAGQIPRRDQIPRGIMFMIGSTILFAGVNAVVKWEVARYPVGEVAFLRSAFGLIPLYLIVLPRTGLAVLRTARLRDHVKRALSQFTSQMAMFLAFAFMPLASAVAISFAAPLFTTLLSIAVLKEKVGPHRWSALAVGFLGVLLITHPGRGTFQLAVLLPLLNAVMISTVAIAIRRMSTTESTETLSIYQLTLITLFNACLLPLGCDALSWNDFGMIACAGLGNGIAQYWWTKALHLAPPSAIVPFNYLSLVWAMIIGFVVWGDVPTQTLVVGAAIVVASGLYIFWRETVRRGAPAPTVS